jgi:putative ABC transport system permease protein
MKWTDLFEEAYRAISANKVRSGLTMLGIVIGIGSVIALMAVGTGSQRSITSSIESTGANLLTVMPSFQRGGGPVSAGRGSAQTLTLGDSEAIAQLDGVAAVAPQVDGRYQVVAAGSNTNTQIVATTPSYAGVNKVSMSSGEFLSDAQVTKASRVAVLGPTAATDLFGDPANGGQDPIGKAVRIKGARFTVIGVTASKGGTGFQNPDDRIYVPLTTGQRVLAGQTKYVSSIGVEAQTQQVMTQVQDEITSTLLERHGISDPAQADFMIMNQADLATALTSTTRTLTLLLAAVAGISLVVGGIGIMNMMLTSVTERTREIGLRKAIGATGRDISLQFLIEAVALTFLSGVIGVAVGWAVSVGLTKFAALQSQVTWFSVALAFGVSAVIGVVFGFYPAQRASRLNPIEALRYE